jgi:hypothetical protein
MIDDKTISPFLDLDSLLSLPSHRISDLSTGARVDVQLSTTSNLTYGSVDVDISIPSLSVKLKSTTVSLLIQVWRFFPHSVISDSFWRAWNSVDRRASLLLAQSLPALQPLSPTSLESEKIL